MLTTILIAELLLAYFLGSVPSAVWVGKWFFGVDVREHGSGNAGATNVIRVLGYGAGIPVLLFDVFKGWFAVELAWLFPHAFLSPEMMVYLRIGLAVAAVLGHIFPVWAGFRGGKGVGTLAGVGIALYPLALLIVLGIFILVLALTRYVSLSSLSAGIAFPFVVWFITGERNPALVVLAVLVAVFIPVTHLKNIRRLLRGEESRFRFRRRKEVEKP
ncbi:MAG TPA: glycerol-3-phosphate 1-O-acyltransferase PlsY [Bacteroidales bacterium]|nr:glycerol-3-phosphate 1-O-acyltransferase PlsY [Bacteroidales bacterium]